jgi:hypothetical protein
MSVQFTLRDPEFFTRDLRTRFPFRYGIASMTQVPHEFLRLRLVRNGHETAGLAAEGLPPKWFTKDPATLFSADLEEMRRVLRQAAGLCAAIAARPVTFSELWRELSHQQDAWAAREGLPPLLAHLGVSLCERAVLDGLARALGEPLHRLVRDNALGLRLGEVYPELGQAEPRDLLPAAPRARVHLRHTLGLADPLTPADIPPGERVDDGLPQDLETSIREYGLRYVKIKLSGQPDRDSARLEAMVHVLDRETGGAWFATVDGNEGFADLDAVRSLWERVIGRPGLRRFREHVLAIEQPLHRDRALGEAALRQLQAWTDRPPLIIDESDGAVGDLPRALAAGYAGTSHKNCKGIVKGLANAALLEHRRRQGRTALLTGEDLCTLGPVTLLQDLAMMALLGIAHIERNGHHYYRGLSMWPEAWQQSTLTAHPDLYRRHREGFACLRIVDGQLALDSVNAAPLGIQPLLDPVQGGAHHRR